MGKKHKQITNTPAKISFMDLCIHLNLGDGAWDDIDWMATVPAGTLWKMLIGHPISQKVAEKVLFALSEHDGETTWNLDNVEVTLLTDPEYCTFFDAFLQCPSPITYQSLVALAAQQGIARLVVHCMLSGQPVEREDAEKVLHLLSVHTDQPWSFETVDVPLLAPPETEEQQISIPALTLRELHKRYTRRKRARKSLSQEFFKEGA